MLSRDVILGMLMKEPLSGYDIKQNFEELFSYFFDASYGTIYPTLSKMENQGYITKEKVSQKGKPDKNLYSITEAGKELFLSYLESPLEEDVIRSDMLMRLYFGHFADEMGVMKWFEQAIQQKQRVLELLEQDYERFKGKLSVTQEMCIEYGLKQHQLNIDMLQDALQKLKSIQEGVE
ncbi:PadR family transcriptional regulator [Aneurinibacillus aneurinilyticus]